MGKMTKRSSLGISMGSSFREGGAFAVSTAEPERSRGGGAAAVAVTALSSGLAAEFLRLLEPLPFLLTLGERLGAFFSVGTAPTDVIVSTTDSGAKETEGVSILAGITVLEAEKEEFIWRTFGNRAAGGQFLSDD